MHGCRSHQHPSLFIPHRKRCKGGIAPACCRLRLMLHPLRAQWVPSRGPLGGGRSRRFRGPGPFSERWPRWVGRVFSPVFPNPLRIDHKWHFPSLWLQQHPSFGLPSLSSPLRGLGCSRGLCASTCPSNSSPLPLSPSPSRQSPASDPFSNLRLSPQCPRQRAGRRHLLLPPARAPMGPEAAWAPPPPGGGGWGAFHGLE